MANKIQIQDRRRTVWEMTLRGIPETMIANALHVHRNTIVNDIREIRKKNRDKVADADVMTEIADAMQKFEEIFQLAMKDYGQASKDLSKSRYQEIAMNALDKKVRFLVEVGVLPRAAQEITGRMVIEGIDVEKASIEELKGLRNRLISRIPPDVLRQMLGEGGGNGNGTGN